MSQEITGQPSGGNDLAFDIEHGPDFAMLRLKMRAGQQVWAEPAAMATMAPSIALKAGFRGGFGRTFGRFLAGESLIVNTFTAREDAELCLAPGVAGSLQHVRLRGNGLMMQRGPLWPTAPGWTSRPVGRGPAASSMVKGLFC